MVMIFSMVYSPIGIHSAHAKDKESNKEEFESVCNGEDGPLSRLEEKNKNNCNTTPDSKACIELQAKIDKAGGDMQLSYCLQASQAKKAKNTELAKSIIFGVATAICTLGAVLENWPLTASAKAVCMGASIGASALGIGADITGKIYMRREQEKYGQTKDALCSVSTFSPAITALAPMLTSAGSSAPKGGGEDNSGCLACAIMQGLMMGMSITMSVSSMNAQKELVKNAKEVKNASNNSVTNLSPSTISLKQDTIVKPKSTSTGGGISNSSDSCANVSGNQYLSCLGQTDPEMAAISNSSEFIGALNTALRGKNIGDFVKNYDGESDLAAYIANGMGVSPSFMSGVIKNSEKMTKETGLMDKYAPMKYSRAGSTPKVSNDLDFSKIMSGMMGKMGGGGDEKGNTDPSELVFRQLELLPADKIQANKDISLFARIAFRYRKNSSNVEQLNWSRPENQSAPSVQKK